MTTKLAVDITVSAVDLTEWDRDELESAIRDAVAAWKADVTIDSREYETGT
ncbi:hypothetical protein [Streptomyces sp. NPDC101249]|uniref:hypothetical protein n=1 Tax=Streptomyces sp. NPDC101249 TaxID=3366140 RepID=UPI00381A58B9